MSDWTLLAGQADDERLEVLGTTYRLTVRDRSSGRMNVTLLGAVAAAPVGEVAVAPEK